MDERYAAAKRRTQEILPPQNDQPFVFGGRPPGVGNKIPRVLKELIMLAAELEGSDGEGKDGALGLLRKIAKEDLKTFAGLMARIIPLQVEQRGDMHADVIYRSVDEVRKELESRGISMEAVQMVLLGNDDGDDAES